MNHARPIIITSTAATILALWGCGDAPQHATAAAQHAPELEQQLDWMTEHAPSYLHDRAWRRRALEESLWRPELPYSQKLLDGYALEKGGWELLPTYSFDAYAVYEPGDERSTLVARFDANAPTPTTRQEWLELGERVFWYLPMRRDAYLSWVVQRPERWREVGLEQDDDGALRGVIRYRDARGRARIGLTCAACHASNQEPGRATSALDLGKARALYRQARDLDPAPFDTWGAGKIDVTDDGRVDPVAIPNLWGVSSQRFLNSSGVFEKSSPATPAIRFETQYLSNYAYEVRPARQWTWSLAMYVTSLAGEKSRPARPAPPAAFTRACASCHDPDAGFSGGLIPADALSSDATVANSPKRGTGHYRVPSLLGVGEGGPYLHDASANTLEEVLSSGHPDGAHLSTTDHDAILDYLKTL